MIELGISYYGCLFKEHIKQDIRHLAYNGVNAIVLAVSEYEASVWFDRLKEIIEIIKLQGMKVYWNFWAWGGLFGGEAASKYLQDSIDDRQVDVNGKKVSAICPSSSNFRNYMKSWIEDILKETDVDGFFWDEPHYFGAYSGGESLTCYCERCKNLFMEKYSVPPPNELTKEFTEFRESLMLDFLLDLLSTVKKLNSKAINIVCLLPEKNPIVGVFNWDKVAKLDVVDVIASDPYWSLYGKDLEWYKNVVTDIISIAKNTKKKSQIWLQLFMLPKDEIKNLEPAVKFAIKQGVDSIFAWTYKAAEGQFLTSEDPVTTWHQLMLIYREIRRVMKI